MFILKDIGTIPRHELELLQTPHPLGFNDNIYHESNISRLREFCDRLCKREHIESTALNTWK